MAATKRIGFSLLTSALTAALSVICLAGAAPATDSVTANVHITAGAVLTITEAAIAWGSAGTPLAAFTTGALAPTTPAAGYLKVNAKCNARNGYMLAVAATDLAGGTETIAASKLGFDIVPSGQPIGAVTYLSGAGVGLNLFAVNEPRTTSAGGKDYDLYVLLNLGGTEAEGSYSGTVTFTLTY